MALEKHRAEMMALLLEEAARNLAAMMFTPEAERQKVRHFLPDELYGCAIILRGEYGIEVPNTGGTEECKNV
jgi:hypothetical protein